MLEAAREDFTNRIGRQIHSMSKAGPITAYDWWMISEEFLDYLGALSVENPDLHTPEAEAVLTDATEAAAGAVAYAAYYPYAPFHVFLNYVNWGIGYEHEADGSPEPVTAHQLVDAFCLAVLSGKTGHHGEAFHFARQKAQEGKAWLPVVELVNGLMAYVSGDLGDDEQNVPPSEEEKLAALDAALTRIHDRAGAGDQEALSRPHSVALRALRALATGDQDAFRTELTELLLPYGALSGPGTTARTLLPLLPLALAALAYRREGWQPPVDTAYLPRALVTGFETAGPRVKEFGRDRRADAVAELAAGPLVVERPEHPQPIHPDSEALVEQYTREAFTPEAGETLDAGRLSSAMNYQSIHFQARASHSADATDPQMENLRLASQLGAALFRATLAEPGATAEVTIDGNTLAYPAYHGDEAGPGAWQTATNLALITGRREDLAALVLSGASRLEGDGSACASYRQALHDYLRGGEAEPAAERAVRDCEKVKGWGFFPPPGVLLSQLVEGDEESFNLALADALEAHRDHYQVADRTTGSDAAINLDVLALTCHARRRGWSIRVSSPYLPRRLVQGA
ncbi:Imm49 family immunity protein [Streptomyces sp. NPDC003042]